MTEEVDLRLETLARLRDETIEKLKAIKKTDQQTLDLAVKEIMVNFATARSYLKEIYTRNARVNEDLVADEETYHSNFWGRDSINHFLHHLRSMQSVIRQVAIGEFEPRFARYY